ncbi:MAG: hypothetical protein PHF86_03095 [Candidatus Nanoarchaeia archaeon]|jgi:hypothetical protein|nr:hypothetical protein [Candidatus Nanoarchaeia archaeon]
MKRAADHDKYIGIIHSIARAEELQEKDKRKSENKPDIKQTCFNCSKKKTCKKFMGKLTYDGAYSIGGDIHNKACNKWEQIKNKQNDPKKIKSLLKQYSKLNG